MYRCPFWQAIRPSSEFFLPALRMPAECCMLTCVLSCCSMSRLGGSNVTSNVQASSLGSNTSMESAKTAAAAQRDPQQLPDDSEQAREAAALVEWIHEQVCRNSMLLTQRGV